MARSTTRSLAGSAAAAAKKVVARRSRRTAPATGSTSKSTSTSSSTSTAKKAAKKSVRKAPRKKAVNLLAGGNPQIAKGEGVGPVKAYIAAIPGWKKDVARRVDDLITRAVPGVSKAVKWNSPFYGLKGGGWFVSFHCFTRYVKVTFFNGSSLDPEPPESSKDPDARYVHLHEGEDIDDEQLNDWIQQSAALPAWDGF